jgi:hypothetical protein
MAWRKPKEPGDFTGLRVLILAGQYKGREGVCTGKSADGGRWAISPDGSNEILQLVFETEFGFLVDLSANPDNN